MAHNNLMEIFLRLQENLSYIQKWLKNEELKLMERNQCM